MTDAPVEQAHQSRAKVFISYSRKDIEFADRLDAALKTRGFETLIDRSDIYAFEEWWKRVEALIARADTVAFVLSPDAVRPDTVALKEVAFAASLNKRFAPIVFRPVQDNAVPEALAKLNFIFFDDPAQFEQSADKLSEALNTDISWIRQHTDFGEQARRWTQAKGVSGLLLRSPVLEQAEKWIASRPPGAPAPTEETQSFIRRSRQGATRRRNVLTGSLAAGLVLALALAVLAYWQRGVAVEQQTIAQQNEAQAKRERDNATRNFQLAKKTADSLVIDIARGLRNVQGMRAETVRKILDTANATFEQLAASAPDDLALQHSRGLMLAEFGDTYLALGDLETAHNAYRELFAVAERLVGVNSSNTGWQHDLLMAYERIGNVLVREGKVEVALKSYRDALALAERLAAIDRNNPQRQVDLWVSYNKLGDVVVDQGKLDEALKSYRDGLAIIERLAAADQNNAEWQRDLSVSYELVGNVLVAQYKLEEALKAYRECLAIAERLAAADLGNTQWQRGLNVAYVKIGNVLVDQGKLDEALKAYREALVVGERLAATDRSNTEWQHDLAVDYGKLARVYERQRQFADAIAGFVQARDIMAAVVAIAPGNAQWKKDLAWFERQITQLRDPTRVQ